MPTDWWVGDLFDLEIEFLKRFLVALIAKGRVSVEVIGEGAGLKGYTLVDGFQILMQQL